MKTTKEAIKWDREFYRLEGYQQAEQKILKEEIKFLEREVIFLDKEFANLPINLKKKFIETLIAKSNIHKRIEELKSTLKERK